jgi:hypothetical protein
MGATGAMSGIIRGAWGARTTLTSEVSGGSDLGGGHTGVSDRPIAQHNETCAQVLIEARTVVAWRTHGHEGRT